MDELISKETARRIIDSPRNKEQMLRMLESIPPAEPKRGKWIHDGSKWKNRWVCSECGYKWFFDCIEGAYCPNCGAKMEVTT